MPPDQTISVIIPTLDEENNIDFVLSGLPHFIDEVIIVDGYSSDKTIERAKKYNPMILYDSLGKGSALRRGMNEAKGEIIILMDADCSHISKEIPLLLAGINAGYDICMGSRFIQGGGSEDITFIRKCGNKFFVWIVNLLWGMKYSDLCYGYRALRREVIPLLNLESNDFAIETEISIKAAKKKLKILEVPSFEKLRFRGSGKLKTLRDGVLVFRHIIREFFLRR
ncbi:MAG: glycosyltransferase family 2 protein [bacterium]